METPIKLAYDQTVRMQGWSRSCYATVFSVEGYARKNHMDPVASLASALERGHAIADFIYIGGALVHDPSGAYQAQEEMRRHSAVVLQEGALVEIESRLYRVKSRKGNAGPFPGLGNPCILKAVEAE